jgi:MFS family permease
MDTNIVVPDQSPEPDSRHSWVVAIVGAVAMVFTFGTPVSYGILREPFSATFGVSSVSLSAVFAVLLFMFFIGSGLVGIFGVRFPARGVLLVCALTAGILAPSLYVVDSVLGLAVIFALLGLSLGTVVVLVASVVPRWFEARRGAATGLIFVGNGLGLFLLPPVWQFTLAELGVRQGFFVVISVSALSFLFAGLVCRRPAWVEQSTATAGELVGWLRGLLRTRTFQLMAVGMAFSFAWYQLLAAYAVELFAARGLTQATASAAFGLIGGISIISRIGGGYLGDRLGSRRAFLGSFSCVAVGVSLLLVPGIPVLFLAIPVLGLGLGGVATLYIPLLMSVFSPEKDTAIVGVFNVAGGLGALTMPLLGTASVAYAEGFGLSILLTLVIVLVGLVTIALGTAD